MKLDPNKFEWIGLQFLKINQDENNLLRFDEPKVIEHICGTVACHAGWCSVIFDLRDGIGKYLNFLHGANALSQYLGFQHSSHFAGWAMLNSDIWLTNNGGKMFKFDGYLAFGCWSGASCSLGIIGEHYIKVANKIRETAH